MPSGASMRIVRIGLLRVRDARGLRAQHLRGARQQDVEVVGAVDEGQVLDEHPRELAAVLRGLLAIADVHRLAAQQLEHDAAGALRAHVRDRG